jgi:hypothetical protein
MKTQPIIRDALMWNQNKTVILILLLVAVPSTDWL